MSTTNPYCEALGIAVPNLSVIVESKRFRAGVEQDRKPKAPARVSDDNG